MLRDGVLVAERGQAPGARGGGSEPSRSWLLIKHRDETARSTHDVTAEQTTSVVTKRTMEQIAKGGTVWHSNR